MITAMRNYFKKSSQVILWVIIAAFVIGILPLSFRQITNTHVWAIRVNGQEVGYQEYLLERERIRDHIIALREQYKDQADLLLSLLGVLDPQMLVVQSLVKQELLNQIADANGFYISPAFVAQKMSDPVYVLQELSGLVPPRVVNQATGIDVVMLKKYLKHFGLSIDMFERMVEKALTERFLTDIIMGLWYLPRFDSKQRYHGEYARKSFSVLVVPLDKMLETEKKREISKKELTSFYDAQRQRYVIPEKRTGMQWEFKPASYDLAVTDKQIEEYYESNKLKKFIDMPAKVQVRHILFASASDAGVAEAYVRAKRVYDELVKNPTKFEVMAKEVSDDKKTASHGGLMEPFTRGTHETTFDRTAFLLKDDGEISDIIRTERGYEIVQRVNKTSHTFKPLSAVKGDIKKLLEEREFQTHFFDEVEKIIGHDDLVTSFIEKRGGIAHALTKVVLDDTAVAKHLFKLQPGNRSFFIEGNKGVVVQLDSIEERHIPTLDSIQDVVTADLHIQRAQEQLYERLEQIRKSVAKVPFSSWKETFNAATFRLVSIDLKDSSTIELLKTKGLPFSKMLQMEKPNSVIIDTLDSRGMVILLDAIAPLDEREFNEKSRQITREFEHERVQQYMDGFVASLCRNAKIETNESVITFEL